MKREIIEYFFNAFMAAFTISMIILSTVMQIVYNDAVIPVTLIWQLFALSILCSFINLVYRSEKLKFIWQSIIGYILTTLSIIIFGLIFNWYGSNIRFMIISFLLYSLIYVITLIAAWKKTKEKKRELNDKLKKYKENKGEV